MDDAATVFLQKSVRGAKVFATQESPVSGQRRWMRRFQN
jgi:hypothetical protein